MIPGPLDPADVSRFLETYLFEPAGWLIDEITAVDPEQRTVEGRMATTRTLPIAPLARSSPGHPTHVTGPELIMLTGNLGCLHAWFFHGVRWDEGWAGFGNRIHRADFRKLVTVGGPPLRLTSRETRLRVGPKRIVIRYTFEFFQEDQKVYVGDQSAIFVKDKPLAE